MSFTPTELGSGVADTHDPSHIAFEFKIGATRSADDTNKNTPIRWPTSAAGIIDAYLQNDDSMAFTLRSSVGSDENLRFSADRIDGNVLNLQVLSALRKRI